MGVLVMADEPALRETRLGLVQRIELVASGDLRLEPVRGVVANDPPLVRQPLHDEGERADAKLPALPHGDTERSPPCNRLLARHTPRSRERSVRSRKSQCRAEVTCPLRARGFEVRSAFSHALAPARSVTRAETKGCILRNNRMEAANHSRYLVKSLVESYGGRVWVEDRVPGDHTKGARFVVMLPAVEK